MKKIYWETKHIEGHFLPWVPLCEQHPHEQLSQPLSSSATNLTCQQFCDNLKFIFTESLHNFLSATNNKRLLFELVKLNPQQWPISWYVDIKQDTIGEWRIP